MKDRTAAAVVLLCASISGLRAAETSEWQFTAGPTGARVIVFEQAPNGDILAGVYPRGMVRRSLTTSEWRSAGFDGIRVDFIYTARNDAMYATVSEGFPWPATHRGVFRSLDSGDTWENVSTGLTGPALHIDSLAETSTGVLLAATEGGLFAFSESQNSWQPRGFGDSLWNLVANPQGDLFALADNLRRLVRSEDGGETWSGRDFPWPLQSLAAGGDGVVVATADSVFSGGCTVFVSTDRGRTFACVDDTLEALTGHAALVRPDGELLIGATPIYPDTGGIWRSTDLGQTWDRAGLNDAQVAVLSDFDDHGYWAATPTQVYRAGEDLDWRRDQEGLVDTTVFAMVPTPEGLVVGGIEFGVQRWSGPGATWQNLGLEHEWISCGLWTRDGQLIVCGQRGAVKRFLDPGQWEDFDPVGNANSLVELPDGRICGTDDDEITCASPGDGDPGLCRTHFEERNVNTMAASGDGSLVVSSVRFGADQTSLHQSGDGGCTWSETWSADGALSVRFAAGRGGLVYAAMKDGEVWRSEDGGLSWELRGQIEDWPLHLVIDRRGRLFAATIVNEPFVSKGGLYVSSDGGSTWRELYDLPDGVTIDGLAIDRNWLYAEPHTRGKGLGIFRTRIGRVVAPSEPPASAVD